MFDQLRGMAIYATVADAGSFSGAAQRMGMSASVVSYHVTALERFVDTPLIYRTTRKLSFTAAGERLAAAARAMVQAAEAGIGDIGQQSANPTGRLNIIAPAILQYSRFVTRTATFIRHHTKVEIAMSFDDTPRDLVGDGFDLGFRLGPLPDSALIARKLVDGRMKLCVAPQYLRAHPDPQGPGDLEAMELIGMVDASARISLKNSAMQGASADLHPRHRISVNSGFAARRIAEEGGGLVLLPDFFVHEALLANHLVEVLPQWDAADYSIYALWPPNVGTNHLRAAYLDFVAAIATTGPESDRVMT